MIAHYFLHGRTRRALYDIAVGGAVAPRDRARADSCSLCRQELADIRETLGVLDSMITDVSAERPEMYWQSFANRVERRVAADERNRRRDNLGYWIGSKPAFLAGAASAVALIAVGFGFWWWSAGPHVANPIASPSSALSVRDRAFDYLERSRVVLIGVLNADSKDLGLTPDLIRQNGEASRVLVHEARELNRDLSDPRDERLRQLVNELEVILVQLTNLEAEQNIPGLEIIRDGVNRRGVLLKITIEEMNRIQRQPSVDGVIGSDAGTDQRSL